MKKLTDSSLLQGFWKIVSYTRKGNLLRCNTTHYEFNADRCRRIPNDDDDDRLRSFFVVDESAKMITIEREFNGPFGPRDPNPIILKWLYQLDGHRLTIAFGSKGQSPVSIADDSEGIIVFERDRKSRLHVPRSERIAELKRLGYRKEVVAALSKPQKLGPFSGYFRKPETFYSALWPASFNDRRLLPLWECEGETVAVDLSKPGLEHLSFFHEYPEELTVYPSIDAILFEIIHRHVWEYGGNSAESNEALEFARAIAFPCINSLSELLGRFEDCTDEEIKLFRAKL